MKRAFALIAIGIFALAVQGGLATFLPASLCPDLGLLVVFVLGLRWQGAASGMLIAAFLGYAADLLAGSLFGTHALSRVLFFNVVYLMRRQFNLRGSLPLVLFAFAMTLVHALVLLGLMKLFGLPGLPSLGAFASAVPHAVVNALLAPWVVAAVDRVWEWLGEGDGFRGGIELDAGGPAR